MKQRPTWFRPFIIGYVILVAAVIAATSLSLSNQDRIEAEAQRRAEIVAFESARNVYANCEAINKQKLLLRQILDVAAAPRPDDEPGEYEERQRQIEENFAPLLVPDECPPVPRRPRGR